ncbi:hypothetical protein ACIBL6_34440 [Streptomyces sp. NPDC050400]|uniref:hypothetical protein n=1 Tax=Streptomyces sp. NPDC050400 TaxID=3365610 RepID=UPI00378E7F9D
MTPPELPTVPPPPAAHQLLSLRDFRGFPDFREFRAFLFSDVRAAPPLRERPLPPALAVPITMATTTAMKMTMKTASITALLSLAPESPEGRPERGV